MDKGKQITEQWYVVFKNSANDNFLTPYLQDGFQHCYVMKETSGGFLWQIVDCTQSNINVSIASTDEYPHPRVFAGENAVILPVTATIDPQNKMARLCVFSCVEVVKGCLGIDRTLIITPYQLYKFLIKSSRG